MDQRKSIGALLAVILTIGAYGVYGVLAEGISEGHTILGKGESSCLKCHYDLYAEMVDTDHGRYLVRSLKDVGVSQPETYACLMCHGKMERWKSFGMADWAVWYENSSENGYPNEYWALGYKQVLFPYGEGYAGLWNNLTAESTSWISINLESGTTGATIIVNVTYMDYSNDNTDTSVVLTESPSGKYWVNFTGIYPDYFKIEIRSDVELTANSLTVLSDGTMYEVSNSSIRTIDINNVNFTSLAPLVKDPYSGTWGWAYFANNWNFHTGRYSTVIRMSEVWDNVRTITEVEFPRRGITIESLGVVGEDNSYGSCSSSEGLCHVTLKMVKLAEEGYIPETRAAYGYQPYYTHMMTGATITSQTCGVCHAALFVEGPSPHRSDQCENCHDSHRIE